MTDSSPAGRILITPQSLTFGGIDAAVELQPLRDAGYELVSAPAGRSPSEEELLGLVPGCLGWLAGVERIPASVIAAATSLRVIARNGVGTDTIDLDAAALAGVAVTAAAGANAQGVAEFAVTLAVCCLRQVPWSAASVRAGGWERLARAGALRDHGRGGGSRRDRAPCRGCFYRAGVRGDRVRSLLVGGGHPLGGTRRARGSGRCGHAARPAPGGRERAHRCGPAGALQGGVRSTARASLVDDDAVLAALEDGTLSACAVDAFASEPPELTSLLLHERVIATPHIGAYTGASVRRATTMAVESLLESL